MLETLASPERVSQHAFWPLLRHVKAIRRFDYASGTVKRKERALLYAAPGDANLFAYYREILTERYENQVAVFGLHDTITAYRPKRKGSNVDFALEAFSWIRANVPCRVYCFDVQGFFDHLDHAMLKRQWQNILGQSRFPIDHYAIFRALTRYAWVDRDSLPASLIENSGSKVFCTPGEFRNLRRTGQLSVYRHSESRGIPQGLAISNLLSNIYMLPFDQAIQAIVLEQNGFYRRYCDDIFVAVPSANAAVSMIETLVEEKLNALGLPISAEKTTRHYLHSGRAGKDRLADIPVQYLGLVDDGRKIQVRGATLGRFHRRMKTSVRHAKVRAQKNNKKLPKGVLRRRFAMRGPRNFLMYSHRIETSLRKYGFEHPQSVGRQLRRCREQLERLLDDENQ